MGDWSCSAGSMEMHLKNGRVHVAAPKVQVEPPNVKVKQRHPYVFARRVEAHVDPDTCSISKYPHLLAPHAYSILKGSPHFPSLSCGGSV